jgi:apolipoprotein D and lipocalin family protein
MTSRLSRLFLSLWAIFGVMSARAVSSEASLQVVPSVDLSRYVGKWYEIAHLPAWFQRDCASDTTATYTLRPDGKISVLNQCRKADGVLKSAKGKAHVARDKGPNTKLKVTFFWPFYGDYWIIDLDPQYRWAVVGEPRRRYLWILSREPQLDQAIYAQIVDRAQKQGYDLNSLIVTRHGE